MKKHARWTQCISIVLLFFFLFSVTVFAKKSEEPHVLETNIGMQPIDYKRMISTKTENKYDVRVEVNGGKPNSARIHSRGNGSKVIGMSLPAKRVPIELRFDNPSDYSELIANTCVKFCNVITPFELLAQHIAYDMFEYLDIPTPAHTFSFMQYNDVDFGMYFVLEDINEEFLAKHFSPPFGSLYKGAEGVERQSYAHSEWFGSLRAVTDHGSERILALLNALNQGEGYEKYLDMDEVLRFFACTAAYGGASSILTELSNFFLYDTGDKIIILPWDMSEAFAADITENGIDHFCMDYWDDAPPSKLFDLVMQDADNREKYHDYIRKICNGFLSSEALDPYFQSLVSCVSPYMKRDCTILFNWEQGMPEDAPDIPVTFQSLHRFIHEIHDNLLAQLDGTADTFFVDLALTQIHQELDDENAYIIQNTSTINTHIEKDICIGYTSYCRRVGISHFATGDPAELVVSLCFFSFSFCVVLFFFFRSSVRTFPLINRSHGKSRKR